MYIQQKFQTVHQRVFHELPALTHWVLGVFLQAFSLKIVSAKKSTDEQMIGLIYRLSIVQSINHPNLGGNIMEKICLETISTSPVLCRLAADYK